MDYLETEFVKSTEISQAQGSAISDSQPIVVGCVISSVSMSSVSSVSPRAQCYKEAIKRRGEPGKVCACELANLHFLNKAHLAFSE